MTTPTLTARLLHALKARGATEIFGIPGDFALPLFREIEREALLPLHTFSHEPAVGFAADAAARARGGLGVAAVTYGAGALNMVNAVASAYAERVPLVVISGAPAAHEITSGFVLHHQVKTTDSQWQIYHELSADRARLDDAADAPAQIARVLDTALRRSLPVYLEIPRDMPAVPCGAVPATSPHLPDPDAVAACADEMLARIRAARQPVLMVGVEVRRFGLESRVAELARRLGVPVVTTFMGRGLLAGADVPLHGTYLGLAGDPALTGLVEGSDALAMLGVIVSDTNFAVSAQRIALQRTLHAFDDRVTMGYHSYHDVPLAALVEALLARLQAVATPTSARSAAPATASPPPAPFAAVPPSASDAAPAAAASAEEAALQPADIADALNALLARHGPVPIASDVGDCLFTAMDVGPTALIAPGYYATMGYGVPAGIGLQAATGQRPIVLVGDGAFQMTGWELGNASRAGCDPVVIVFNNASWEMLRAFTPDAGFNALPRWDFAAMAAGMGGDGHAVATRAELRAALERAWATRGRFQLVDVRLAPGAVSPTLSRFVRAVKRVSMPDDAAG